MKLPQQWSQFFLKISIQGCQPVIKIHFCLKWLIFSTLFVTGKMWNEWTLTFWFGACFSIDLILLNPLSVFLFFKSRSVKTDDTPLWISRMLKKSHEKLQDLNFNSLENTLMLKFWKYFWNRYQKSFSSTGGEGGGSLRDYNIIAFIRVRWRRKISHLIEFFTHHLKTVNGSGLSDT